MFHFSMICSDFLPGSNVAHIENKETHVNENVRRSRFFRLFLNIRRIKSFFGMGGVTVPGAIEILALPRLACTGGFGECINVAYDRQ